jgi:hypothetical protein
MNPSMKDKVVRAGCKKEWVNKWTRERAEGKGEEWNERNKCFFFPSVISAELEDF